MLIYFVIAAGVVLTEIVLKKYLKENELDGTKIGENVRIELMENKGAAGGRFAGRPELIKQLNAILLGLCTGQLLAEMLEKRKVTVAGLGLALVIGGGLSNFLDRLRKGSVTDYLRFPKCPVKRIGRLVFNLADFSIFLGSFLLLFRKK